MMDKMSIVICGSMSHYDVMMQYRDRLDQAGIPTLVPTHDSPSMEALSKKEVLEIKSDKSRTWLKEVGKPGTYGILVVNERKKGIDNYIGANTFAEIAVAFHADKQIFLLHNLYNPYEEELLAWKAVPLLGRLEELISAYYKNDTRHSLA